MKTKFDSTLILIVLFVQKVHKANGGCSYDSNLKQCSCSLLDLSNFVTIIPCVQASSFEFNGGTFINPKEFPELNIKSVMDMIRFSLTKISLLNMDLSEDFLAAFINVISQVSVELLSFENTTFVDRALEFPSRGAPLHILSLQFINTSSNPLTKRDSAFDKYGNWMSILRTLTVNKSLLRGVSCELSLRFHSLLTLDLSENFLSDDNVSSIFCNGTFPNLQTLKLRSNNFRNYETLCQALRKYNQLRHLDVSLNDFSLRSNSLCKMHPSLSHLNLSNTGLEEVGISLPPNCEVLDLSHNRIEFLNISLPNLRELYLSYNRLSTLSSMGQVPLLQILAVDGNLMKLVQVSDLQTYKHLESFRGDNLLYTCSCSFIKEMKELAKSNLTLQGWPDGYTCDSPESVRGQLINEVNQSLFECHTQLLTVVICIVTLLLCVSIIICFVKICRSNKARSQCMEAGNSNSV